MRPVWAADWTVTKDLARDLIEDAFPSLVPISIRQLTEGWDNYVYLVNNSIVFRFPRRTVAVPALKAEIRFLPWLARQLDIAVPNLDYIGQPSEKYPSPFVGYPFIDGQTLVDADIQDDSCAALARALGSFLRRLHDMPLDAARDRGLTTTESKYTLLNDERVRPLTDERMKGSAL